MPRARAAAIALLRCASLCAALGALFLVGGGGLRGIHSDFARAILVLLGVGGGVMAFGGDALLPRAWRSRPVIPLVLLALDLIVIGAVGTFLRVPDNVSVHATPSAAFLVGYLVAVLVAAMGRRPAAGALGVLAGAMLLLLAESRLMQAQPATPAGGRAANGANAANGAREVAKDDASPAAPGAPRASHAPPDEANEGQEPAMGTLSPASTAHPSGPVEPVDADPSGPEGAQDFYVWLRILLVAAAAFQTALVTGWIDSEIGRRRTSETVDRELRAREMIASEMAVFSTESKSVSSLGELKDALLLHLRMHFQSAVRAVFLEDAGDRVAVWEEAASVDEKLAEDRRLRLQQAVRDAGSTALVPKLELRANAGVWKGRGDRLRSTVGVPVHGTGRVGGLIFLGDSNRDSIPPERLGALAELGRQAGDSLRRIERARDEQTRRTSLLLSQMREGVLLVGSDAKVAICNPSGRKMLELLGQRPDAPVALGSASAVELASIPAGAVRRYTAAATSAEGRAQKLSVVAVGVADSGTRLGTLVTLTDITEEEQARQRLMQAEKMSVVGQTLASVAHELNNPLAAIVGYSDLLAEAAVPPDVEKLLTRIREQATRTSRIVKNLLNVARRRGPERTRVSLNDVATSVVDLFAYDARLNNIAITTELDPDLPAVLADRHALQQVLVNLCQNAIHALRGSRAGGRVEIRTRADRGAVYLVVRDDGPGVPAALKARVFEAFFTTKGPDEGTGLGLAISRGIAREHGGDLILEDRHDGHTGAQFTIRVPIETRAIEAPPEPDRVIPDGVPARVLVVDDEAPVRDSLIATLGRFGAQVDGIGTAAEAERRLYSTPYDAVLLDVRLPGRSGLDLHRDLKAKNPALARKIVFMTGDLMNDDVIRAIRATGNALIEKPFTADELRTVLASAR